VAGLQDPPPDAPGGAQQDRRELTPRALPDRLGVVAIGRNEGERLRRCLESVVGRADVVYVDSGSTDGSRELARGLGAHVVELDLSRPFTAARARNAGLDRLLAERPHVELVMFVDGDCEVVDGFLARAAARLDERPELAVVCGRRRERHPEASLFNRLCDLEWDTEVGDTDACGGDAMMRVSAVREVDGFDPALIAGEEPDLCVRLRRRGWRIERIDAEMTLHDAAMTEFGQWWSRNVRAGHAFAEGSWRHGRSPERHWVSETKKVLMWGGVLPTVAVGAALPTLGLSLGLLAGYPVSTARNFRRQLDRGRSPGEALLYSVSCTASHFPELQGALRFYWGLARGRRSAIIEYKR
jgi:GT2 family glycosyltransferase